MRSPIRRPLLASAPALLLCAILVWSAPSVIASGPASLAGSVRHLRVSGYLTDSHPSTDDTLAIYSKTHRQTYRVVMTSSTVVKVRTTIVPRARLQHQLYVIVTCDRRSDGALVAVTVHIEYNFPHHRSKHH